jgi:hypothetical protein
MGNVAFDKMSEFRIIFVYKICLAVKYKFSEIFQYLMEFKFHHSYVIPEFVNSTLIFCTELSCWRTCYLNKTTLFLGWSRRYKIATVFKIIWLTVPKYQYLKWQWIFCFLRRLFFPLSQPRLYRTWLCMSKTAGVS